jgi:hypothetical protein
VTLEIRRRYEAISTADRLGFACDSFDATVWTLDEEKGGGGINTLNYSTPDHVGGLFRCYIDGRGVPTGEFDVALRALDLNRENIMKGIPR